MGHNLIIGGTGMLKNSSIWLGSQGNFLTVVGRDKLKLDAVKDTVGGLDDVSLISLDYHDVNRLTNALLEDIKQHGAINRAVVWMSANASDSLQAVVDCLSSTAKNRWALYHVLGSAASRPTADRQPRLGSNCDYYQVILGFKQESGLSRWLTHREISDGVIDALKKGEKQRTIIGLVEPWDERPI